MTPPSRFRSRWLALAVWLGTIAACVGCSGESNLRTVRVFAAASLTRAFQELATAFELAHPRTKVQLHCAGTPRLVLQLQQGAPADVFASADSLQMQRVLEHASVHEAARTFATNRLCILTANGNPHGIQKLEDLQAPAIDVLLCGPNVPAGRYAREALASAGVAVESRSDEPSVRAVISKVQLGLVDAGIVYATDANRSIGPAHERMQAVTISEQHNVTASYPIVALRGGEHPELGAAFVAFVLGSHGCSILANHGFGTP